MASSDRTRSTRNALFAIALVAVTLALGWTRLAPLFGDDEPEKTPRTDLAVAADSSALAASPDVPGPPHTPDPAARPEMLDLSFQAYAEQYEAVRDSFRARDELVARVVGMRVVWEGVLRNVSKQSRSFYVSVSPRDGYGLVSALLTFPDAYEDTLYAFRPDDRVRFEGVVTRASSSVGIDGTAIERIRGAAPAE